MDFGETRRHQRDKTSGAVENKRRLGLIRPRDLVLSPSRGRAARCWPSAGLRVGQLAVSSQVPWLACGRLPLRGYRGPRPVRASVHLSSRGHTCRAPPRACSVSNATSQSVKVPGWHVRCAPSATEVTGAVPDATGITPSAVCDEERQGCRREVSAQAGDEHPSASPEPNGQLET